MTPTSTSHHSEMVNQEMGAVQAAVVSAGLEWIGSIIPVILLVLISVCCYRKKQSNSSRTEMQVLPVEASRPVAEVQGQVRDDEVINIEQKVEQKDFILVVSEH